MDIDLATLAGIINAHKQIEEVLSVSRDDSEVLGKLEGRVRGLSRDEVKILMRGLLSLKDHCKVLGATTFVLGKDPNE